MVVTHAQERHAAGEVVEAAEAHVVFSGGTEPVDNTEYAGRAGVLLGEWEFECNVVAFLGRLEVSHAARVEGRKEAAAYDAR